MTTEEPQSVFSKAKSRTRKVTFHVPNVGSETWHAINGSTLTRMIHLVAHAQSCQVNYEKHLAEMQEVVEAVQKQSDRGYLVNEETS